MAINEIHQFDARTTFEIQILKEDNTAYSLIDATLMEFRFQKPDGSLIVRPASLVTDGSDGTVRYVTDNTDLDQPGLWRYQAYIEKGPVEKNSDIGEFRVHPNLPLE